MGDGEEEVFYVSPGTPPAVEDTPAGWTTDVKFNDGNPEPGISTSVTVEVRETLEVVIINRPQDFMIPENPI